MTSEMLEQFGNLIDIPYHVKNQRRLPEYQAQEGTYQLLNGLEGRGLGSVYTKRAVWVKSTESIPDRLEVEVRIKHFVGHKRLDTYYKFGISSNDQVDTIEAERDPVERNWFNPRREKVTPPHCRDS